MAWRVQSDRHEHSRDEDEYSRAGQSFARQSAFCPQDPSTPAAAWPILVPHARSCRQRPARAYCRFNRSASVTAHAFVASYPLSSSLSPPFSSPILTCRKNSPATELM